MTIFTGTRRTILTKLPVAFSVGKVVKRAPLPCWMLSTWPRHLQLRIGVHLDADLLADAHAVQLRFLEVGDHPGLRRTR